MTNKGINIRGLRKSYESPLGLTQAVWGRLHLPHRSIFMVKLRPGSAKSWVKSA